MLWTTISALEQQARITLWQAVEKRIQRPADPEVFLHVLHGCPQACSRSEKEIAPLVVIGRNHGVESGVQGVASIRWRRSAGCLFCTRDR